MENIKIATAQFENKSNDKGYNLSIVDKLSKQAATQGAKMIAFHECSITGYTFARNLSSTGDRFLVGGNCCRRYSVWSGPND